MKVTNHLVGLQNWFQYRLKELIDSKTSTHMGNSSEHRVKWEIPANLNTFL